MNAKNRSAYCVVLAAIGLLGAVAGLYGQSAPPVAEQPKRGIGRSADDRTHAPAPTQVRLALSCPYCQLQGVQLTGRTLTKANLLGADLTGADLSGAILDGAVLTGANLTKANLDKAQLASATNGPAHLAGANLTGATLRATQVGGSNLQFAAVPGADFTGTDLGEAIIGPAVKAGVMGGKKTSFRNARLPRGLKTDESTMDLTGASWASEPGLRAAAVEDEAWACGNADLSPLASRVYVAPNGTDNATCGASVGAPCQTIRTGILRCSGSGCGVLVAWGEYPQTAPVVVHNGVNMYGGCLPASQATPTSVSVIMAPPGDMPAMLAINISTATILQGFQLSASAASGTNGAPSIGLLVVNSRGLAVLNSEILANTGAPGAPGGPGAPGAPGGPANGGSGGTSACNYTSGGNGGGTMHANVSLSNTTLTCAPSCDGGSCVGQYGESGSTGVYAQGGNPAGGDTCAECPTAQPGNGNGGGSGQDASCGTSGSASEDTTGSFSGETWTGSIAGTGGNGGNGGGGGGGSTGGDMGGWCFWVYTDYYGSNGGGGGGGGCGGAGGLGGQQGGASFAVLAANSTLTLTQSRIVGGLGGAGGQGGPAGTGGAGGSGAGGGAPHSQAGTGGQGGNGGAGGGGAGGTGGNGGPAIGVALVGNASIAGTGTVFYSGGSGGYGSGGAGAKSGSGNCTGATGSNGNLGLVADTHQF
jgi:Pentapeptide repeats (8 copies)